MKKLFLLFTFLLFTLPCFLENSGNGLLAQCDTIASICSKHMLSPYLSDGQQYRALLLSDQNAEFHATFFGGSTYRIAGCSGLKDGNLVFSLFDEQRNLIFTNKEHQNSPFWDFKISSTLDVILEASLATGTQSGCAVVLIGFKQ